MANIHRFPWGTSDLTQVWIVHCGSKSTPMIAQLCREVGLQSRIINASAFAEAWMDREFTPKLVILSGGDQSVYDPEAFTLSPEIFGSLTREATVLGICYGAQLLAKLSGGTVRKAAKSESGVVTVTSKPFGNYRGGKAVMNHGDEIVDLPEGWEVVASTERCAYALVGADNLWAVQFHPEMDHTEDGEMILQYVAFGLADCGEDYAFDPAAFVRDSAEWMTRVRPPGSVICGLSGGVDSAVAFSVGRRAYGTALQGIYVDTGWMREGETDDVCKVFGSDGVSYVDAGSTFHTALEAIPYPQDGHPTDREFRYYDAVRKTIGSKFVEVFLDTALSFGRRAGSLIQGTNYADIIESETGLKAHHNVGGLPERLGVDIIEPLAGLYKFEIRALAEHLGLPEGIAKRQPFPGPGLAIRAWGKLSRDMVPPLQRANRILEEVVQEQYPSFEERPCQYYAALAPLPSTGLMGDKRVIGYAWVIRMVTSVRRESYTTLGVFAPSPAFIDELTHRLVTETAMPDGTPFVRVFYEWTGKPPSTTEPH